MTIAQTILSQLGGNRFIAMTGAKNLINCGDALQFNLPRGFAKNKANKVRVTYEKSADLYSVVFYKWNARKLELNEVSNASGCDVEQMREVMERETGLALAL